MDIGEQRRTIYIEPIEDPAFEPAPRPEMPVEDEPALEPEPVS